MLEPSTPDSPISAGLYRPAASVYAKGLLGLALLLGLSLRVYWVLHHSAVLQGEECEYSRLAENLATRHRYEGMFEGPQLVYPPLFPALIAAASAITHSVPAGGRLVTVSAGLVLILAVFLVARHVYGWRVGLVAATLSACHPLLVYLSGVSYSESVALPLVMLGIYCGLRCIDRGSPASAILCGLFFGLAYLTRPDALFYPLIVIATLWLSARLRVNAVASVWRPVLHILIPFALLVLPYAAYLSIHTGGLRFEGKSIMNYAIGSNVNAGMDLQRAFYGIGPGHQSPADQGPFLSPNAFVAASRYPASVSRVATYWITSAWRNRKVMPEWLVAYPAFGSIAMIGLVTIALVHRPWSRRRLLMETVLLTTMVAYLAILFGLPFIELRFLLPLLPFLIIWMSKGIDEVSDWAMRSARRTTDWRVSTVRLLGGGVRCVLAAAIVLLALRGANAAPRDDPKELALRQAGLWLAPHVRGDGHIMAVPAEVAYYSGAVFLPLPAADAALALEYVRAKDPDFIVLTHESSGRAPYLEDWLKDGIAGAPLVYRAGQGRDEVAIHDWKNRAEPEEGDRRQ
jgi:4-amino-4-deoxy-L-arabinose transferase-like glycosyltransferase